MTISFFPEVFQVSDACECIYAYMRGEWLEGHDSCSGMLRPELESPNLNIANENSKLLFLILGLPWEATGKVNAAELLCRIFEARRKVSHGQIDSYLDKLAEVAHHALENDHEVCWA